MKRKEWILLVSDIALFALVLASPKIAEWMLGWVQDCWVAEMGLLCPACGGTRCIRFLSQGRILEAIQSNWYVCLLLLYGGVLLGLTNLAVLFRVEFARKAVKKLCNSWVLIVLFAGFAVFGVLRNFL